MDVSIVLILLLAGAFATYFSGDKLAPRVALLSSLVTFAAAIALLVQYQSGADIAVSGVWVQKPQIMFALSGDGLSLAMLLLNAALLPLIIYSTFGRSWENAKSFYALVLFMGFAMAGTFLALDGFLYYIFWELALVPIYFIALIWGEGERKSRQKAVVKFFIYTFAGSLFMLAAFAYLYTKAGTFLASELSQLTLSTTEQTWIFLGFFAAYAIKIPLIPFHSWQAAVYERAPAAGTMLLSGLMLKMGLYSLIRWQLPIAPFAGISFMKVLIWFGLAGVLYGSVVALRQRNLKRLLAYSSLAHVGLIAAGTYTLTLDGFRGAVLQMIAHGFVIVGLFFASEIISRRYNTHEIVEMGGIRTLAPRFAAALMILVFASVALPGTFNFVGEFLLLFSLSHINLWFAVLGGLTIVLSAYYMLRMYQHVMLGPANAKPFGDMTTQETIVMVAVIGVLIFFGLYPKPVFELITPSLEQILSYIHRF